VGNKNNCFPLSISVHKNLHDFCFGLRIQIAGWPT
jgi:hypothetical protein